MADPDWTLPAPEVEAIVSGRHGDPFAVLGLLPLVPLAQLGFAVAFGVLLDTIIVRSILVPALVHEIGPKIWWPSKLQNK